MTAAFFLLISSVITLKKLLHAKCHYNDNELDACRLYLKTGENMRFKFRMYTEEKDVPVRTSKK